MSHYCIAVLSSPDQDIDFQLSPFDESLIVAPYIAVTKELAIQEAKENVLLAQKEPENPYLKRFLNAKTDEELYDAQCEFHGYNLFDKKGNIMSVSNKNAKYDWYEIGGRYNGILRLKSHCQERHINSAPVDSIDFGPNLATYQSHKRFFEVIVNGSPLLPGERKEDFRNYYDPNYLLKMYRDAETYAKIRSSLTCFAILDKFGKWHQKGEVGWFGSTSATPEKSIEWDLNFEQNVKKYARKNDILTIVDCHI